jgi:hypothetical protein
MSDNAIVFRVTVTYALVVGGFWLLFLLNKTHHWLSLRHFLALSMGIGVTMCVGAVLAAVISRRSSP